MEQKPDPQAKKHWIYIVVKDPDSPGSEFMAYENPETSQPFIPAFETKEEAQQCFLIMPKEIMKYKYEVQAILKEDLLAEARRNDYHVYILDDRSKIKGHLT